MTLAVRPKTSDIVKYQLPEQYQNATKLVSFLKAYYEWIEQDGNAGQFLGDLFAMKDIDLASDEFIDKILVQMIKFVPKSAAIDRKFLAKHIRDFFDAKGSLVSYEFILQALFGEEMTKRWMGDYVLKASDSDFGFDTIIPISVTNGSFHDALGSFLRGPSGQQAKVKDVIKTVSISGKEIELVLLDNGSVKGRFSPGMDVKALTSSIPTSYYEVLNYYDFNQITIGATTASYFPQTTEDNAVLSIYSAKFNFSVYDGLVVRMVGATFRAVVESAVTSESVGRKIVTLTLKRDSVTGDFTGGDELYLISSFLEDNHYNKSAYVTGVADYAMTGATIPKSGSLYYEGLPVRVDLGSGKEATPYISTVGTGGVSSVLINKFGKGYVVGDVVQSDNRDSGGDGFEAHVENIDGIGAEIITVLELDAVIIRDGGTGFEPGDKFEFTYDDNRNKALAPIRLTVDTVQSEASRSLNGIVINSTGSGYQYTKIALSANGGAPIAGFTFSGKIYPNTDPLFEPSFYASTTDVALSSYRNNSGKPAYVTTHYAKKGPFGSTKKTEVTTTYTVPTGAIYDIVPSATTTLPAGTITVKVNGYGATLTPTVNGSGAITSVAVTTGGYNYVDPVIDIIGDGYGAVLYPIKDGSGTITSVTVSKQGTGYNGALSVIVRERYGSGFSATPLIGETAGKGKILTMSIDAGCRGEYVTLPDVQKMLQSTTTRPSYLRYIPDPTGSAPFGENAVLDFEFRVKRIDLKSGGYLYNNSFEYLVPGGTGGRVLVTTNNSGQVSAVTLLNAGTGYSASTVTITPSPSSGYNGPGSGAQFNTTVDGGKIQTISSIVGGTGYYPTNISFMGCHGSGAALDLIVDAGQLKAVYVLDSGSAYSSTTTISFTGSWTVQPTATLVVEQGRIISVTITNAGSGITDLAYSINYTGTMATAHPVIVGNGGIKRTVVLNGGTGYYATDEVTPLILTVQAAPVGGVTATVLPVLDGDGNITGVVITNPGAGYLAAPTISVSGGVVVGAPALTPPSFTTGIFDGRLVSVTVGGVGDPGYMYGTRILVNGTGTGAILTPVINSGVVKVVIGDGGTYTANQEIDVTLSDSDIASVLPGIVLDPAVITIFTNESGAIYDVVIKKRGTHHVTPSLNMAAIPGLSGSGGSLLFFVDRNIESVEISSEGEKYTKASTTIIGDGALAEVDLVLDKSGVVEAVVLDSGGTRITRPPVTKIVDSSNYGAVSKIRVMNAGSGYYKTPLVYLAEGTRTRNGISGWVHGGAEIVTTSSSIGAVKSVDLNSFGYNYEEAPKLTAPICAIVDNVVGFKTGEIVRSKAYTYYAKNILPHISSMTGTGAGATVQLRTPATPTTIDVLSVYTADLGIEIGMYFQCVSSDTAADGAFKIIAVTQTSFDVEFSGGISVTGPITLTDARIDSDSYGPHGTLQYVDTGRKLLVITNATESYRIISETGDPIMSQNGFHFETEDSFDMNDGASYVGATTKAVASPLFLNRAKLTPVIGAVGTTEKKFTSERGRINMRDIRVADNNKYQDYAYVITTGIQVNDYKSALDATVHPAGFKMFGETTIQKTIQLPIPSTKSSASDQFINLFFTPTQVSIDSEVQSDTNTPERRYYQRFWWNSNNFESYNIAYGMYNMSIEDYDYEIYDIPGKFRHTNEALVTYGIPFLVGTYNHSDQLGGVGNIIRVTKNGHGLSNGTVVRLVKDGTITETGGVTNSQTNTFDVISASDLNTTGNVTAQVMTPVETAVATSMNEQDFFKMEFLSQSCSATGDDFSHDWDAGYWTGTPFVAEPYPHPTTVNANLLTIDMKEVDLVTGAVRTIEPRCSVHDVVWIKNLVSDTTDFSNGILTSTNVYQPFSVVAKTASTITVFLTSPQIVGTKTGKVDVLFNAPYINK